MMKEKRRKIINVFFVLLLLFFLNELFAFQFDKNNSLLFIIHRKFAYEKSIEEGFAYYNNRNNLINLKFDGYWLGKYISLKLNKKIDFPPELNRKFANDPSKRMFNMDDFVPDIKFEKKNLKFPPGVSYNNFGYRLNAPYNLYVVTPIDDVFYKSLYCDLAGYDDEDFLILKSIKKNDGGYWDTHYLIYLLLLKKNGCYFEKKINAEIEKITSQIIDAQKKDFYFSDLYAERIVVLYWAGKGNLIDESWIEKVKNNLTSDPGWRDKNRFFSDAHTTGLALLSLIYYREGNNFQQFKNERSVLTGSSGKYRRKLKELEQKFQYRDGITIQIKNTFMNCVDKMTGFEIIMHPTDDVAIIKFQGFEKLPYLGYPVFIKDSSIIKQGKFLCRLGFPFPEFSNFHYNEEKDDIEWTKDGKNDSPRFPIEGMITRGVVDVSGAKKGIEMSTPGLRGQSGGPLFDQNGVVYGMQSSTHHLHLGFDIKDKEIREGSKLKKVSNHPFLHLGNCVHVDVIKSFLKEYNIKFYEN